MTGADTLEYEARIEDPVVYTRPWTLRTALTASRSAGARIIEDECLEDANGVATHLANDRNLLKSDYSRWKNRAPHDQQTPVPRAAAGAASLTPCPAYSARAAW